MFDGIDTIGPGPCAVCGRAAAGGTRRGAADDRDQRRTGARRRSTTKGAARLPRSRSPTGLARGRVSCVRRSARSMRACPTRHGTRSTSGSRRRNVSSRTRCFSRHGIRLEALADDGVVVPGQPVKLSASRGQQRRRGRRRCKSVQFAGFDGGRAGVRRRACRRGRRADLCKAELRRRRPRACRRRTGHRARTRRATTSSRTCRSACRSGRRRSAPRSR